MPKQRKKTVHVDIDNPATWVRYRKGMCNSCNATCCKMPVEAKLSDLLRMGVIDAFDLEEPAKLVAKSLKKAGIIDHFNAKREVFTLARRANSDCIYLDAKTRRCTIYNNRPDICREHPQVGPRPNHCAYIEK